MITYRFCMSLARKVKLFSILNNACIAKAGFSTMLSRSVLQNNSSKLCNKRWEKDVVYLYQLNRPSSLPSVSPFCFKIETWLRAKDLKYEIRKCWSFQSLERYWPFVELNGEKIVDSYFIIERLQEHFNLKDELEEKDMGVARAINRMIDCSTYYLLLYFKFDENMSEFSKAWEPRTVRRWLAYGMMLSFSNKVCRILADMGLDKCSRDDLIIMLRKDIGTIDSVLLDKQFLFGVKPTLPDFTVFGHLATSYYLPFHQPITDILDDQYPRVKRLIERMKQHYYPEWEVNM